MKIAPPASLTRGGAFIGPAMELIGNQGIANLIGEPLDITPNRGMIRITRLVDSYRWRDDPDQIEVGTGA